MAAKKLPKGVQKHIDAIKKAQYELGNMGYEFDFVEDSVVLVDRAALKVEMQKPINQVNVLNYVINVFT